MRTLVKTKISRDSQKMFIVTSSGNSEYSRVWKKASLSQYSKRIYGVTLSDWLKVHKGRFGEWKISPYKP